MFLGHIRSLELSGRRNSGHEANEQAASDTNPSPRLLHNDNHHLNPRSSWPGNRSLTPTAAKKDVLTTNQHDQTCHSPGSDVLVPTGDNERRATAAEAWPNGKPPTGPRLPDTIISPPRLKRTRLDVELHAGQHNSNRLGRRGGTERSGYDSYRPGHRRTLSDEISDDVWRPRSSTDRHNPSVWYDDEGLRRPRWSEVSERRVHPAHPRYDSFSSVPVPTPYASLQWKNPKAVANTARSVSMKASQNGVEQTMGPDQYPNTGQDDHDNQVNRDIMRLASSTKVSPALGHLPAGTSFGASAVRPSPASPPRSPIMQSPESEQEFLRVVSEPLTNQRSQRSPQDGCEMALTEAPPPVGYQTRVMESTTLQNPVLLTHNHVRRTHVNSDETSSTVSDITCSDRTGASRTTGSSKKPRVCSKCKRAGRDSSGSSECMRLFCCSTPRCRVRLHRGCGGKEQFVCVVCKNGKASEVAASFKKMASRLANDTDVVSEDGEVPEAGDVDPVLEGSRPPSVVYQARTSSNDDPTPAYAQVTATAPQPLPSSVRQRVQGGPKTNASAQRYQEMSATSSLPTTDRTSLTLQRRPERARYTPKMLTCLHWSFGDCHHGEDCYYAHTDTGLYFPNAGEPAKHFTCYQWFRNKNCRYAEADCLNAHYDTGLYLRPDGFASEKHITCFWWHLQGNCNKSDEKCHFAHYDTGTYAHDPAESRKANKRQGWKAKDHAKSVETARKSSHVDTDRYTSDVEWRGRVQPVSTRPTNHLENHQRQSDDARMPPKHQKALPTQTQDKSSPDPRSVSMPDHSSSADPGKTPVRPEQRYGFDMGDLHGVNETSEQEAEAAGHQRASNTDPRLRKKPSLTRLFTNLVSVEDSVPAAQLANDVTPTMETKQTPTASAVAAVDLPRSSIRQCDVCGRKIFGSFATCKECLKKPKPANSPDGLLSAVVVENHDYSLSDIPLDENQGSLPTSAHVVDLSNEALQNDVPAASGVVGMLNDRLPLGHLPSKWDNASKRPAEGGDMFIPSKKHKIFHVPHIDPQTFLYHGSAVNGLDEHARSSGPPRVISAGTQQKETLEALIQLEKRRKESITVVKGMRSDQPAVDTIVSHPPNATPEDDLADLFEDSQGTNSTEKLDTTIAKEPKFLPAEPQLTAPGDGGTIGGRPSPESHESSPPASASTSMDISTEQSSSSRSSIHPEASPVSTEMRDPDIIPASFVPPRVSTQSSRPRPPGTACANCRKRHRRCEHPELAEVANEALHHGESVGPLSSSMSFIEHDLSFSNQEATPPDDDNRLLADMTASSVTSGGTGRRGLVCASCRAAKKKCRHSTLNDGNGDRLALADETLGASPESTARRQKQQASANLNAQVPEKNLDSKLRTMVLKDHVNNGRPINSSGSKVRKPSDGIDISSSNAKGLSNFRHRQHLRHSPTSTKFDLGSTRAGDLGKGVSTKIWPDRPKSWATPHLSTQPGSSESASKSPASSQASIAVPAPPHSNVPRRQSHRETAVVKSKHFLAAIERMKAAGVEFDADDDSNSHESDSQQLRVEPTIVRDPQRACRKVSRDLFEVAPQYRTENILFNLDAKRQEIAARPNRKENLRRLKRNGTGALLFLSDRKSRRKYFKDIHHEVDRALPSRTVITTREKTPENPMLAAFPAIDEERETEKVEVTFEEFLGIPAMPKYTTVGVNGQLAFRDGMKLKQRVPDGEKLPVGTKS